MSDTVILESAGHGRDETERIWPTPQTESLYRERFPDDWARYDFASQHVRGRRVLDCASGAGYGSWLLARAGAQSVIGVDVSEDALSWARGHFVLPSLEFRRSDGGSLPLESGSVDQVVSLETIEHVPAPKGFVKELARVLVPNGGLVMSTPLTFGAARLKPSNRYHLREYDDEEFASLLSEDFEIVQRLGQHSSQSARYADLKRAPGIGRLLRSGIHRLVPDGLRQRVRTWLLRSWGNRPAAWISSDDWMNAPVQIVVARKRSTTER